MLTDLPDVQHLMPDKRLLSLLIMSLMYKTERLGKEETRHVFLRKYVAAHPVEEDNNMDDISERRE